MRDLGMLQEFLGGAEDLAAHLARLGPDVRIARRLIAANTFNEGN